MIHKILPLALVASASFAAAHVVTEPSQHGHQAEATPTTENEIAALRADLEHLTNRLNHLETEIKANNPEGEFKQMTIDSVRWTSSAEPGFTMFHGREHELELVCHVAEWSGYPRMLRFTRKADHQFYLEAPGHRPVEASMSEGGITNDSGSTRLVVLTVNDHSQHLEPGVQYSIRPRNDSADYKWVVPTGIVVPAK